jgi:hypothetical protein
MHGSWAYDEIVRVGGKPPASKPIELNSSNELRWGHVLLSALVLLRHNQLLTSLLLPLDRISHGSWTFSLDDLYCAKSSVLHVVCPKLDRHPLAQLCRLLFPDAIADLPSPGHCCNRINRTRTYVAVRKNHFALFILCMS